MGDADGDVRARGPQAPVPSQSLDFALCKMEAFLKTGILFPLPGLGATSWCSRKLLPERFPRTLAPQACGNEQSGERGCWEVGPCRGARSLVQGSRSSQECGDGVSKPQERDTPGAATVAAIPSKMAADAISQVLCFIFTRVRPANPQPLGTRMSSVPMFQVKKLRLSS